jgi:hypothetical protein
VDPDPHQIVKDPTTLPCFITEHARSPGEAFNVEPLQLLAGLVVEDCLGRLAGDLLEDRPLVLGLQIPVDEVLHLGELHKH